MTKILTLSVVAATLAIPAMAARHSRPAVAFRRLVLGFAFFSAVYVLVVMFATPNASLAE